MNLDQAGWKDIASILISILALLISVFSLLNSRRAHRLAQLQESRRQPLLSFSLLNGYLHRNEDGSRVYAFLISASNLSDSNNAAAKIELHLTYCTSQTEVTAQFPSSSSRNDVFAALKDFTLLPVPSRLDAHQTITGWVIFQIPGAIMKDTTIEAYQIAVFDSHGIKNTLEPIFVQEYIDETVSAR